MCKSLTVTLKPPKVFMCKTKPSCGIILSEKEILILHIKQNHIGILCYTQNFRGVKCYTINVL